MGNTYEIGFPETLAGSEELITGGTTDDEVLGKVDTANTVKAADKRLPGSVVDSGNDGADKVWTETALVERARHEVGHCLRRDLAFLAETVHVDLVAEEFADG